MYSMPEGWHFHRFHLAACLVKQEKLISANSMMSAERRLDIIAVSSQWDWFR